MTMRIQARNRQAFTLVEMLVVVAIIAMLVTISMPVINRALEIARISRARSEVNALESAFRAYYNTYHVWPSEIEGYDPHDHSGNEMNEEWVKLFSGENVNNMNRRRIAFMEFAEHSLDEDGAFIDPWGSAYRFVLDHNYDNTISVDVPGIGAITLNRRVGVWSLGKPTGDDGEYDEEDAEPITSWGS